MGLTGAGDGEGVARTGAALTCLRYCTAAAAGDGLLNGLVLEVLGWVDLGLGLVLGFGVGLALGLGLGLGVARLRPCFGAEVVHAWVGGRAGGSSRDCKEGYCEA